MFEWLKRLFLGKDSVFRKIREIADRIKRFMDRFEFAEEEDSYNLARKYYNLVIKSETIDEAEHYEKEFYKRLKEKGIINEKYESSRRYANEDYDRVDKDIHSGSSDLNEAAAIYHVFNDGNQDNSGSNSEIQSGSGEFGGGGASDSWEETGSDNS